MPKSMTHRERVLAAINHQQPDKVPLDLGSTVDSSIVVDGYIRLAQHLGIAPKIEITHRMMQTVNVEERVLRALDIDTRGLFPGAPDKSVAAELGLNQYRDAWGCVRVKPPGSYYYDQINFPLQGDISLSDIVNYPWPDPDDPGWIRHLRGRLNWIRQNTDCAAVLAVPAPFVHMSQYLRGFQDWYMDFILNPNLLDALFNAVLEVNTHICKNILKEVGQEVDIILTADDLGTQNGLQVSYAHYRNHIHPRLEKYFRLIHDLTPAKILLHSCGSLAAIIEDLIQIGVDILNPIQVSAAGMDPAVLKQRYGDRLAFWGAINSQHILPFGGVEDVKREVETRVEQLGKGGGYVLGAVHNIQPDVPVENILAMYQHAREYVPSF
ncbi:MAG: uroporphyrinogen decarboxylase family protein [Thermodesulfobacteriota bacterium]|nr:uroporphyrinogen decarboxylase family protein [Thermodesulfobacteriota bacterium]